MKSDADKVLAEFQDIGERASRFLADDTGSGEWRTGYQLQIKAMKLYRAHPELQERMRDIARERFIFTIVDSWSATQ